MFKSYIKVDFLFYRYLKVKGNPVYFSLHTLFPKDWSYSHRYDIFIVKDVISLMFGLIKKTKFHLLSFEIIFMSQAN